MSSSSEAAVTGAAWAPSLDLTPKGLSRFDPERVRQAIRDGYEAGLRAGHHEAVIAGREARDAELERVRSSAAQLFASLEQATEQLARQERAAAQAFADRVAEAGVRIAAAIVQHELSDESTAAVSACQRALTALGRRDGARLQLHPDDIALLEGADLPGHLELEPNPALRRGDALAHTDDRTVDARIDAALDRALAALRGTSAEEGR